MVDKLTPTKRETGFDGDLEERIAAHTAAQTPARLRGAPWVLVLVLLAAIAWLGWQAFGPQDNGDPISTSIIAFEKQNELTVFSAELSPVVASEDSRYFDLVQSRQVAVIPASVRYTLDLSAMDRGRMEWDEASENLTVRLPQLTVSRPNLDEARAQYLREGLWITREAQDNLTRQNTRLAEEQALKQAENPVLLDLARSAARDAIRQNLAIPLQVAGFGELTVTVLFDGETQEPQ